MSKDKYPQYGLVAVAAIAIALWAGLPVSLLLFLLVCPLMMFFMMRGMHGGHENNTDRSGHDDSETASSDTHQPAGVSRPRRADGSHERIDHP